MSKLLGDGLLKFETKGISNTLHEKAASGGEALPIRFINTTFIIDEIKTPAR